ncbi:alpha/beta fold hydrolase [Williamsia phyllosphaerae]|uniref:alpha/beta fold hydrolase n=1 Tax=Williamsia phyllosphaerae TaxID=885042 RepID=UPI00166E8857|nr:alpha/beta fold hydrolase [Williamsia phyllosphaerae]
MKLRRAVPLIVMSLALVAGCSTSEPPRPAGDSPVVRSIAPPFDGSAQIPTTSASTGGTGPGAVVSTSILEDNTELQDVDAKAIRMVFRSTEGTGGKPTEVSGLVAIPPGVAPEGGWPVIAFGHGTTGVLDKCAPSQFDTLVGNGSMIASMIQSGFAVAMPDYQGLGVPGYRHPFLDGATFGNNMIDAVRAAHNLDPAIGTRWAAFGHSLGGLAAWGAADRAGAYGQGLDLTGTLAMAPPADMSGLADAAQNGTLTADQRVALIFALQTLSWSNPGFDLDRYRTPSLAQKWDLLLDCTANLNEVLKAREAVTNADLKPDTPADTTRLRDLLEALAVPKNKITGPMLLMYGTKDTLVDYRWTDAAVKRACAQGDVIDIDKRMGQGHSDLESARGLPWIKDRIDGHTADNTCPGRT